MAKGKGIDREDMDLPRHVIPPVGYDEKPGARLRRLSDEIGVNRVTGKRSGVEIISDGPSLKDRLKNLQD